MPEEEKEKRRGTGFDLGLSGLLKGIGSVIDLAAKMAETARANGLVEVEKHVEFRTLAEARGAHRPRGVYGVSVQRGIGGIPRVRPFGNIRRTERGPIIDEVREPLVDVFDEEDVVLVVAELPGVAEKDIRTEVSGDMLKLSTTTKGREYAAQVQLPCPVDAGRVESTYKNGVLEIRLSKTHKEGGERNAGEQPGLGGSEDSPEVWGADRLRRGGPGDGHID